MRIHDPDEPNRLSARREDGENIVLFNPSQVTDIDVISTVLPPRLITKSNDVPTNNGSIIEYLSFQGVAGLKGKGQVIPGRGGHLIGRISKK